MKPTGATKEATVTTEAERLVNMAVHGESYKERVDARVKIIEQLNERKRLREALLMFKVPATGCWCSDDPRIFDHSVRCQVVRAALNDATTSTSAGGG